MAQRQHRHSAATLVYPQYEWAFDTAGKPVPITLATRGGAYVCPLCGSRMIARLGEVKQHHFAHEELKVCTPENVTRAAAKRWLAIQLEGCRVARRVLTITWSCAVCGQPHSANLLDGVSRVVEAYHQGEIRADVALLDAAGSPRAVLAVNAPDNATLAACIRQSIPLMVIKPDDLRHRLIDLPALLAGASIYGGACTMQQTLAGAGVITDPAVLRQTLEEAANRPPFRFYGPLETFNGLTDVFTLGDKKLWLPPAQWKQAVGGMVNTIAPQVKIISQEWPQYDHGVIALFYVTVKDKRAIAVRRFGQDQPVYARLDTSLFRTSRITAIDVARSLAER